ncbi:ZIP family metal transporter [Anaerosporobacter faecicola]|uniref:ZIP family metal transporter n=1 Tax=Anaerosporobacter faecicola TaxID=2718714 RepID=UPI001439F3AC|nr:ZIP family metal transporter [Anaerosporobacter faecicola]
MDIAIGILIPFAGTTLGALSVLFLRKEMPVVVNRILLGFASGVMVAASVWSLLLPAITMSEHLGKLAFLPAVMGFAVGILLLLGIDCLVNRISEKNEKKKISKGTFMLVLAVTLHNIPEGMAVGVAFAGVLAKNSAVTIGAAMIVSMGIAIQNIPEGAVISMPLREKGKGKAFFIGTLSGIVEPIASGITLLMTCLVSSILPYLFAFAAGAMIFVVIKELLPEATSKENSYAGTIGFAVGFLIMMTLDVALS